jgi:predicted phage tail protein
MQQEPLTTVRLMGELGDRFSPEYQGVAYTLKESISMLFCQEPTLKDYLAGNDGYYQLVLLPTNTVLSPENPDFPVAGKEVVIMPVVEGSGTIGRIIGGLALVGLGIITGGTSLIVAGAVMVAQSLFFGYGDSPDEDETKRSEVLGIGGLNTAEGNPIPVVYGHDVMVGGLQVLSFSIKSEYTSL